MSDGDNPTPGRHGQGGSPAPDGPPDTNQWLTRSARPSPVAAPWERGGADEGEDASPASASGNHTDGVTVADLIAKLNGDRAVPTELKRHRAEAATPPPTPPAPPIPPAPPTEVIDAVPALYPRTPEPPREDIHAVRDWPMDPAFEATTPDSPDTEVIPVTPAQGVRTAGSGTGPPARPRATVARRLGSSTHRSASPAPGPPPNR